MHTFIYIYIYIEGLGIVPYIQAFIYIHIFKHWVLSSQAFIYIFKHRVLSSICMQAFIHSYIEVLGIIPYAIESWTEFLTEHCIFYTVFIFCNRVAISEKSGMPRLLSLVYLDYIYYSFRNELITKDKDFISIISYWKMHNLSTLNFLHMPTA